MARHNNARRWDWTRSTSWIAVLSFILTAVLPLPALAGDAVFYYHNDTTGSPVAVTNSAGTKVWGADYEPFGELAGVVETVPNNQQFLARTVDPETSLHLLGARYYDGKIGRFLGVDPGLLRGEQASWIGRAQFHNLYTYSVNNPYRYADPSGENPIILQELVALAQKYGTVALRAVQRVGSRIGELGNRTTEVVQESPVGSKLLESQAKHIDTIKNIIRDHATENDFSAVAIERAGGKILKQSGTPYNHVRDMERVLENLTTRVNKLENSLKNQNHSEEVRQVVKEAIEKGQQMIDRMTRALND